MYLLHKQLETGECWFSKNCLTCNFFAEMRFTEEHEWVRQEGSTPHVTVGITDYAQVLY